MRCHRCNAENDDSANFCTACGTMMRVPPPPAPHVQPPKPFEEDPAMRILLPVGRSGWAIAAGYLGLFSVLLIFAPFALVCGILALFDLKRNPKKCGKGRAIFGIVMGVLGTFGLLAAIVNWWGTSVGGVN